jgi:hypothetical protein
MPPQRVKIMRPQANPEGRGSRTDPPLEDVICRKPLYGSVIRQRGRVTKRWQRERLAVDAAISPCGPAAPAGDAVQQRPAAAVAEGRATRSKSMPAGILRGEPPQRSRARSQCGPNPQRP